MLVFVHTQISCRDILPKSNSHAPNSLGLEAVGARNTGPVTKTHASSRLVQILCSGGDKCIGRRGICVLGGFANNVAVEERQRLAQSDCADDEGDEEKAIDASHDEEAEIGPRPVIAYADHDVESGNACLDGLLV